MKFIPLNEAHDTTSKFVFDVLYLATEIISNAVPNCAHMFVCASIFLMFCEVKSDVNTKNLKNRGCSFLSLHEQMLVHKCFLARQLIT